MQTSFNQKCLFACLVVFVNLVPQATLKNVNKAREDIIGSLGNLLLVSTNINSNELASKPVGEKIKILIEKKYPLSGNMLDQNFTGELGQVRKRLEDISKKIYQLTSI